MGSDEVDAAVGAAPSVTKHIAGARQPIGKGTAAALAMQPEAALGITVAVVPLQPTLRKSTKLITTGANVPGLRNHQALAQHRVAGDGLQQRCIGLKPALNIVTTARQHRGQVKAEPIHTKLDDPATKALQHGAPHERLVEVDAIAAAGPVGVTAALVRQQVVIQRVVDAPKRQRGAPLVKLGRMVVDHVEHHLKPATVQSLDHGTEFTAGIAVGTFAGIAGLRRTPGHWAITPVVAHAKRLQPSLVGTVGHGHQTHRGHPQGLQMRQHRRVCEARIAAALAGRHLRMQRGEALNVQLVDHAPGRVRPRPGGARLGQICHNPRLERSGGVVAQVGQIARGATGVVPQMQVVAGIAAQHRTGGRVKQQFGGVEPMPLVRGPGTMHTPAIHQTSPNARPQRQGAAPDAVLRFRHAQAQGLLLTGSVKEAKVHGRGMGRGQRELDGATTELSTEQRAVARLQGQCTGQGSAGGHVTGCITMHDSGGKSRQRDCGRCCHGSSSVGPAELHIPLPP